MIQVKIVNKLGLHARASAAFVKEASRFESDIFVIKGENRVNGKSIMGLLTLAAACGEEIGLEAEGADATQALKALKLLIDNKFNEE